jgi:iron complex outermembrane receptor protein
MAGQQAVRGGQQELRRGRPSAWVAALPALALAVLSLPCARAADDITQLSLEQLLEVKVVGASKYEQKQSEVGAAVSVITRSEIRAFGWRTLDQALASLPGVYTTYDHQYVYLGVRGLGLPGDYNSRILVLVDGNRVNDPTFDTGPFGRMFPVDMDMIERIEFIPGPGGAVYGQNAMFAVVNVVTRGAGSLSGAELAVGVAAPQGLHEGRASWGREFDNGVDLVLSASASSARGANLFYDYNYTPYSGYVPGFDKDQSQQFQARAARGPWSFEFVHSAEHKGDPTADFFSDPLVAGQYTDFGYTLTQLRYDEAPSTDSWRLAARLFTGSSPMDSHFHYGSWFGYPAQSDWWGGELRAVSTAIASHTLMLGLEAQDNYHVDQAIVDFTDASQDYYLRQSGYRAGVYGQDEWRLSDSLNATLGLRVDRNTVTGNGTTFSPRLALVWQADAATVTKALYGIAHRAPNAFEDIPGYYVGATSIGLQDETIDTLEFDVDRRLDLRTTVRASVYEWRLHDLLKENTYTGEYQNTQPAQALGLELSGDRTWDSGARLRGSVSLQDAGYRNGTDFSNSPRLLAKLNESTPLPFAGLHLGVELRYDGPRLVLNGSWVGGGTLANLYLGTEELAPHLEVALAVTNLLDHRFYEPASPSNWQWVLPQDGRSTGLQLRYAF